MFMLPMCQHVTSQAIHAELGYTKSGQVSHVSITLSPGFVGIANVHV